jgi:DNA polymerase III gamma/tau subunit
MARLNEVSEGGADVRQFVEELVTNLRGLLLARSGSDAALTGEFSSADLEWLRGQAAYWSVGSLITLVAALNDALARTRDAFQFQVQVELALLAVCDEGQGIAAQPLAAPTPRPAIAAPVAAPVAPLAPIAPATPVVYAEPAPAPVAATPIPAPTPGIQDPPATYTTTAAEIPQAPSTEREAVVQAASEPVTPAPADVSTVAAPPAGDDAASLAFARERWADVKEAVARKMTVAAVMSTSRPLRVEGDLLVIGLETAFNLKNAEKPVNRPEIEKAVAAALRRPYRVKFALTSSEIGAPSLFDDPVINFAARTFGGEPRLLSEGTSPDLS